MFNIEPVAGVYAQSIQQIIDTKTKPLGALGQLEVIAKQLVQVYSEGAEQLLPKVQINKPCLLVFAADHGIAQHGVSIAPSDVTRQMVLNFMSGGAAINVFTKQLGWQLDVVDSGIMQPMESGSGVKTYRLGSGTNPIHLEAAMNIEQVMTGFEYAKLLVREKYESGCNLLAFGEMGIGNTSSASAIMAAIMGLSAKDTVGKGTGINDETFNRKLTLVQQALDKHKVDKSKPLEVLAKLGGFEIVQICGAMLAAAELRLPVIVDGFICTAAALVARHIEPNVMDYLIFAHVSEEQAHQAMLNYLGVDGLLDLRLRLGEGTGAALSLPIIQSSLAFYNDMASFEQADVEDVVN